MPVPCLLLLAAQPAADPLAELPQLKQPALMDLGAGISEALLVQADGLEHVALWRIPHASKPACRAHLGAPDAKWVLVGLGGRVLLSGDTAPVPAELQKALGTAGQESPLTRLASFLDAHPDHLEAQERLLHHQLQLARRRAWIQGNRPLDDREDLRIWGPLSASLDRLWKDSAWQAVQLPEAFAGGPPDQALPEAASHHLKTTLRRHWDRLLAALDETPEDEGLLRSWLWTSRVLDEPLLPRFQALTRPPLGHPLYLYQTWPGDAVWAALWHEARRTEGWPSLGRLLVEHWQTCSLEIPLPGWRLKPRTDDREHGAPMGSRLWTQVGMRALEACLRAGKPEDGAPILDDLSVLPDGAARLAQAARLAVSLDRADVAKRWGRWEQARRMAFRFQGVGLALYLQGVPSVAGDLMKQGLEGPWPSEIRMDPEQDWPSPEDAEHWRHALGWHPGEPRWALAAKDGRILAHGQGPVPLPVLVEHLQALSVAPRQDPPRLPTLNGRAGMVSLLGDLSGLLAGGARKADLEPFLLASQRLRSGNAWLRPGFEPSHHPLPVFLAMPPLKAEAEAWLNVLEEALERQPGRIALWDQWLLWSTVCPRNFTALLRRLEVDPLIQQSGLAGLPERTFKVLQQRWKAAEDWASLAQAAQALWERALEALPTTGEPEAALLGRTARARRAMEAFGQPLSETLGKLGKDTERDALEQRFRKLIPEPTDR